jgi:SPP1 family phage portal protein
MSIGVKRIKIPIRADELTLDKLRPYLQYILTEFEANSRKITANYETYLGKHNVLTKTRPYDSDLINHRVVEPHLYAMVDFKCGYALGNPKEYAQREGIDGDEIIYLNKYWKDADGRTVDNEVTKWVYSTGVGYYFIQPKKKVTDVANKAPFEIFCQPANTCAKIYSSYIGEEPLCDLICTKIKEIKEGKEKDVSIMSIYFPDWYAEYRCESLINNRFDLVKSQPRMLYKMLPLVEKYSNSDRLGMVEIGKSLQDAIDNLASSSLDNIDDVVNLLYIFINVSLGTTPEEKADTFRWIKQNGVAELTPTNPQFPADLKTLAVNLNHTDVQTVYKQLREALYDCLGVPLQTASVGSGNNAAAEAGAGWANAYTVMLKDINSLIKGDIDLLEHILFICKNSQGSMVKNISASDIDVKYNINRSENLLVKAQAYDYFREDVPPELILKWIGITNEPDAAGKAIAEYKAQLLAQQQTQFNNNQPNTDIQE